MEFYSQVIFIFVSTKSRSNSLKVEKTFIKGDAELAANFPISAYMDRRVPQVAKLQESFIKNLVGSACSAYSQSGLLPGILLESTESDDDKDHECGDDNGDEGKAETTRFFDKPNQFKKCASLKESSGAETPTFSDSQLDEKGIVF